MDKLDYCHQVVKEKMIDKMFECNDSITQYEIVNAIMSILEPLTISTAAIDDIWDAPLIKECICSKINNTPDIIDMNQLIVDMTYVTSFYSDVTSFQYIFGPNEIIITEK